MKKTTQLLSLALLFISAFAYAQDEDNERPKRFGTHNGFNIDLGINNYLEDGGDVQSNSAYAVKPWGSWYVALKSVNDTHISGPLHLYWGGDISWYNFKFQDESTRIFEGPDQVEFVSADVTGLDPVKSKLTAAYVNASIVPMIQFGQQSRGHHHHDFFDFNDWDDNRGFRIGIGAYAGYRIASYSKFVAKENGDREKNKDKEGFYLNNFRYGVRLQAGFRNADFFVNYDLNELFAENRGPKLNAFSFGVVL